MSKRCRMFLTLATTVLWINGCTADPDRVANASVDQGATGFTPTPNGPLARSDGWWARAEPDGSLAVFSASGDAIRFRSRVIQGPLQGQQDGTLVASGQDGLRERIAVRGGRLEQVWEIAEAPRGHGPLRFEVEVSGTYLGSRTDGLRFRSGEAIFVYGHGTFVDATGQRTPVSSRWERGHITLELPPDVLRGATYPAVLDPVIGPEIPVTTPTLELAFPIVSAVDRPVVGFDGTNYVVFHRDDANTLAATRVSPAGVVLDRPPVTLGPACQRIQVFWMGTEWSLICSEPDELWRISPDLATVTMTPIALPPEAHVNTAQVASDGSTFLVAWVEWGSTPSDRDVYASRMDGSGTLLDSPPLLLGASGDDSEPHVAWLGSRWLVAYTHVPAIGSSSIEGVTLDSTGAVLPSSPISLVNDPAAGEFAPFIAPYPAGALLLYGIYVSGSALRSGWRPLDSDGTPIGSTESYTGSVTNPGWAWTGSRHLFAYTSGNRVSAFTVPSTGGPASYYALDGYASIFTSPSVSWNGSSGLLAYYVLGDDAWGVQAEILEAASSRPGTVPITVGDDAERPNRLVSTRAGYVLVADEDSYGLSPDGAVFSGPASLGYVPLLMSSDSGSFALEYTGSHVRAQRLSDDGAPTGAPVALPWSSSLGPFEVACLHPGDCLVVTHNNSQVFGRRIRADGTGWVDTGNIPLSTIGTIRSVSVSSNDTEWLVSWRDDRSYATSGSDIFAVRVAASGLVVGGVEIPVTEAAGNQMDAFAVPLDSDQWAVAWRTMGNTSLTTTEVAYAVIDGTGGVGPPTVLQAGNSAFGYLRGTSGRTRALFVWSARVGSQAEAWTVILDRSTGAPVEPAGPSFELELDTTDVVGRPSLHVATVGGDDFLIAYSAYSAVARNNRAFVRRVTDSVPLGTACASASDCDGLPCVDGVCCADACGGGVPDDCLACSRAAGALHDGTCTPLRAEIVCRPSVGACDQPERCDGVAAECPSDLSAPDGAPCSDADLCNGNEVCALGICQSGPPLSCDDFDSCTSDSCDPTAGCVHVTTCFDAGVPHVDGGIAMDGGISTHDAGSAHVDAGVLEGDGGIAVDGGVARADAGGRAPDGGVGPRADGGPRPSADAAVTEPPAVSGCGCRVPPGQVASTSSWWWMLATLGFARRRRRR